MSDNDDDVEIQGNKNWKNLARNGQSDRIFDGRL
jgi:hypothetical protein